MGVGGSSLGLAEEVESSEGMDMVVGRSVVTANRREEKLQDVAMAVTVVDPVEFTSAGLFL